MSSPLSVQSPVHSLAPAPVAAPQLETVQLQDTLTGAVETARREPSVSSRRLNSANLLAGLQAVGIVKKPAAQHAAGGDLARAGVATTAVVFGVLGAAGCAAVALTAGIENLVKEPSFFNPAGTQNLVKGILPIVFTVPIAATGGIITGAIAAGASSLLCCCACVRD